MVCRREHFHKKSPSTGKASGTQLRRSLEGTGKDSGTQLESPGEGADKASGTQLRRSLEGTGKASGTQLESPRDSTGKASGTPLFSTSNIGLFAVKCGNHVLQVLKTRLGRDQPGTEVPLPVRDLFVSFDIRQFLGIRHSYRTGGLRTEPNQGATAGRSRHSGSACGKFGEHIEHISEK